MKNTRLLRRIGRLLGFPDPTREQVAEAMIACFLRDHAEDPHTDFDRMMLSALERARVEGRRLDMLDEALAAVRAL